MKEQTTICINCKHLLRHPAGAECHANAIVEEVIDFVTGDVHRVTQKVENPYCKNFGSCLDFALGAPKAWPIPLEKTNTK